LKYLDLDAKRHLEESKDVAIFEATICLYTNNLSWSNLLDEVDIFFRVSCFRMINSLNNGTTNVDVSKAAAVTTGDDKDDDEDDDD
jgi:hypothetical protein